ncbi:MAG TPA: hypothetical protein VK929_11370 [Longimicrobiales bacterium]|nr:hypothetical protein [Longimicrobiales bacterium]
MSSRIAQFVVVAAAVSMTAAAPAEAVQHDPNPVVVDQQRADELRAQAEAYFGQPQHWRRAARLLERSAALRPAEDPAGYSCLVLAASLRAATGDYAAARRLYEKAGDQAMARGAVMDAAHAYIDAAHAATQGRSVDALDLVERARLLASSPLLSAAQAEQITHRIAG